MTEKTQSKETGHRRYSKLVTETNARAASRGMLYGVGFKKGDFQKSQVGIASTCCLLYTSPSPRDLSTSRMPSSA